MTLTPRQKGFGVLASVAVLVVAIVLVMLGYGRISVLFFVAAGIGMGMFGPPTDSSGIHGASDAN